MPLDLNNKEYDLALDYITQTKTHIFITGKAGTGKTTFLKNLKLKLNKKSIVVAPTGVAAINAGGVTMHSMFSLPFHIFIPQPQYFNIPNNAVTPTTLISQLKMSGEKKTILQELDVLIIDEISMVRADMLDAVDTILKHIRKNDAPFGGVQMVYFGDMFQLPPVLLDSEKKTFLEYYRSPYFFDALAYQQTHTIPIEFKTIYRQQDQQFIDFLNRVRTNQINDNDLNFINQKVDPDFEPHVDSDYIILTTKNQDVDYINQTNLSDLKGKKHFFEADIVGDFPTHLHPCLPLLELKVGAQVMFIRNDTQPIKQYYNGKMAVVSQLNEDGIKVRFTDTNDVFQVRKETWENIQYKMQPDGSFDEEILGTFTQYPLRLAWAITIHKSQGLTLDKTILDIKGAFEFGQVYVALSRCKSFKNIVLKTPLTQSVLFSQQHIQDFLNAFPSTEDLITQLPQLKIDYALHQIKTIFDFQKEKDAVQDLYILARNYNSNNADIISTKDAVLDKIKALENVTHKFYHQVYHITLDPQLNAQTMQPKMIERFKAGVHYYYHEWLTHVIQPCKIVVASIDPKSTPKPALKQSKKCLSVLYYKLMNIKHTSVFNQSFLDHLQPVDDVGITIDEPPKQYQKPDKNTFEKTLQLYQQGHDIETIMNQRKLAKSTIESHLVHWVNEGVLKWQTMVPQDTMATIMEAITKHPEATMNEIKNMLPSEISYFELKLAKIVIRKNG